MSIDDIQYDPADEARVARERQREEVGVRIVAVGVALMIGGSVLAFMHWFYWQFVA